MKMKTFIRKIFGKLAGINKVQEQIDTLFYFLNAYADINAFPRKNDSLAILQQGDTLLLRIVDAVCQKHHLPYWLEAGTCLGAIRHQGFIPWDDDMDICMLRDDYERAVPILREELGKYGIDAKESSRDAAARIGIGYKHSQTGIWIDLRPFECMKEDCTHGIKRRVLMSRIQLYRRIFNRKREGLTREKVFALQRKYVGNFCKKEEAVTLIRSLEWAWKPKIWHYNDIFPLRKALFDGYEFPVPNDTHAYLTQFFGNEYMSFPREGIEHHTGELGKLRYWAEKSGTDMNQIIHELNTILASVSSYDSQNS